MDSKKDTNTSFGSQDSKNIVVFKLFEKDNYLLFVYKKSERIVSALYLVSNLLPDAEPVKWEFRNIGVKMISQMLSLTSNPLLKSEVAYRLNVDLIKLLSLLDISNVAGLISEMNFNVLKKELEHLIETLNIKGVSQSPHTGKKNLFDREFFAVSSEQLTPGFTSASNISSHNPSSPNRESVNQNRYLHTWSDASQLLQGFSKGQSKGHIYIKDKARRGSHGVGDKSGTVHKNVTSRQSVIIEMLKSKNSLTIKDFGSVINDCSDKTIQRELLKLVKFGVLKKDGERRWSRYSLLGL
ncbi:MAG: hypothetical protein UW34_C0004G0011 [Parcubacteria group bacterium GW2011_GWA2_44_15]|nr:MAG: hypothetical protein UW34_C0004G0011 [Parcubacteria group bacterium GW2011_GWA2_44_15]